MEFISAELTDERTIKFFPEMLIGEGTEKEFYATEDDQIVVGFYKEQHSSIDSDRIARLHAIIEKFNPTLDPVNGIFWKKHFCWPVSIVIKPRIGFLAPKFPNEYYFSNNSKEKTGKWFTNKRLIEKLDFSEKGNLLNRILICRQLARAVGRMHASGLAHSDLSGNNILMNPSTGNSLIIDIDSLVVRNVFPPKVLGTRGYIAPEIVSTSQLPIAHPEKKLPNIKSDLHSLAVIIYETLLLRHPLEGKKIHHTDPEIDDLLMFGEKAIFVEDPEDSSNRSDDQDISFSLLGPYLAPLILRAFTKGLHAPEFRPTAYEWEEALTLTTDLLCPCPNPECWYEWFIICSNNDFKKTVCPFCRCKIFQYPVIMNTFRQLKNGQYLFEKHYIPIWNKKKIFDWHIRSNVSYPPNLLDKHFPRGQFYFKDNRWFLKNKNNEIMTDMSGRQIFTDQSHLITSDTVIHLAPRPNGKVAIFTFN